MVLKPSSRNLIFLAGIILAVFLAVFFLFMKKQNHQYLTIQNHTVYLEIADTTQERNRGLSGRNSLAPNQGMLFLFPEKGNFLFWMKDMRFNLDFVFLEGEEVVDLVEDISAPTNDLTPPTVSSPQFFDKVLELNAGSIKRLNLKVGDKAKYNL